MDEVVLAARWRRLSGFSAVVETTVCVGLEAPCVGLNAGCAENSFVFPFFLFISFADAVSVVGATCGVAGSTGETCASVVEVVGMSGFQCEGPSEGGNSARSFRR